MNKDCTEVEMQEDKYCDVCRNWGMPKVIAKYDAKTTHHGQWAFLCERHFSEFGIGLGLGIGQRLIRK